MTGRREWLAVGVFLALGIVLRGWHIDTGWFGVDQARDIQTALDVVAGRDLPTVGPTMRRLTSLGAGYYYVWALPHMVSAAPIAAYAFAALMGIATLVAVWWFARRAWGAGAGVVALAVFACAPIAVLDGRVAWAPAALPITGMLVLTLLAGPLTTMRLGALGAVLGVAVQLHLSMVAWGVAAFGVLLLRWPGARGVGASALGFLGTGFPALYAVLVNAGRDAGLAALPSRGPGPDVGARLSAVPTLGARVLDAFWQWPDAAPGGALYLTVATAVVAIAALVGLVRLAVAAARRDATATAVVAVLACQLALVALLPGDAWYYYLDPLLPVWALAAGAGWWRSAPGVRHAAGDVALALVLAATLVLGGALARWIALAARHGYLAVHPAALALDGMGGRDAPTPGRLPTFGTKRAVAAALATEPADFATRWRRAHGPAFDDVTGDNGFWWRRASTAEPTAGASVRHVVLWYRDDPTAPTVPIEGFTLETHGPIVVARYHPTIAYETCRDEEGGAIAVPIRLEPDPRRYGDGTIARPAMLPRRITCALAGGAGAASVVASVTAGTVTVRAADGGSGTTGTTSVLCVGQDARPATIVIDVAQPTGAPSDLDLYERPDPACAAKIAP